MTAAAGLLCMSLAACSKPAEKAPAPAPAAPATTAPAAAPAPAPTAAAPAAANATTDTVVTKFKANGFSPAWEAMIDGNTVTFEVPEIMTPDGKKHTRAMAVLDSGDKSVILILFFFELRKRRPGEGIVLARQMPD